jgi:hypothetical protein
MIRRKFLALAVLLPLTGLGLAALAGELLLRLVDPYEFGEQMEHDRFIAGIRGPNPPGAMVLESFYLRPGAHVEFLGASFDFNDEGYRTPVVPKQKPDDVYRIVVVGDSVPFGWGVREDACFPRRLETLLNEVDAPFGKDRVEVVNLSGPGRGLGDYYIVLKDLGLSYEPDLVLVPFIFNDVPIQATEQAKDAAPPPLSVPAFARSSYLARMIYRKVNEARGSFGRSDYWIGIRSNPEAAKLCCLGFQLLDDLAGDVPLVVFDTVGDGPGQPMPEVVACTATLGVPRIECFLPVDEWNDKWAIEPPVHKHPNEAAHDLYARTILAWLEEQGGLRK